MTDHAGDGWTAVADIGGGYGVRITATPLPPLPELTPGEVQNHIGSRGDRVYYPIPLGSPGEIADEIAVAHAERIRRADVERAMRMIRKGSRPLAVALMLDSVQEQARILGVHAA